MIDFRVSVLIPVFNAERYLKQAVESALAQQETGEVILVEDGSIDGSLQVCYELTEKHDNVILLQHLDKKNHGAGPTRNLAIEKASFEFLAFLDADDYFLPLRFEKTKQVFNTIIDCDGVYECIGAVFESEDLKMKWEMEERESITTVKKIIEPKKLFSSLILEDNGYFSIIGFTFKKAVFKKSKSLYFESIELSQDILFLYKLAACSSLYPGEIINPVTIRRVHPENRHTKSKSKAIYYKIKFLEKLYDWLKASSLHKEIQLLLFKQIISKKLDYTAFHSNFGLRKKEQISLLFKHISNKNFIFSRYFLKNAFMIVGLLKKRI